ncbi:MAG: hypothetical protein M3Q48_11675 [Actinomycetota bacterium]|nr:hypothetical protein [Actinomycetota bacterium]
MALVDTGVIAVPGLFGRSWLVGAASAAHSREGHKRGGDPPTAIHVRQRHSHLSFHPP